MICAFFIQITFKIDKPDCEYKYTGGNRCWKGDVPIVRLDTQKYQI